MKRLLSFTVILTLLFVPLTQTFSTVKDTVKKVRIEAETGYYAGNAKTHSYASASKGKVAAFIMNFRDALFIPNVPKSNGMTIGYAKGPGGLGKVSLYINNVHTQDLVFSSTGGWGATAAEYGVAHFKQPIPKGATIKFQIDSGDFSVNFDYVDFYTSGMPPAPPKPSVAPIQRIEAENTVYQGGTMAYDYPLASKGKVAAYMMLKGDAITIPNAPKAKGLVIGYTNGTRKIGNLSLYVNDKHVKNITFPFTSGHGVAASDYQQVSLAIDLPAAANVKFQIDSGDYPVNLDFIDFYTQAQPPVMTPVPFAPVVLTDFKEPLGPTIPEIRSKWRESQATNTESAIAETPSFTAPYSPGKLNTGFLNDGLKMANFMRFLANLPNDLVLSDALNHQAQHGAVLNAAVNQLNHHPAKPADMPQDFYDIAHKSTSSSNLANGAVSLPHTVLSYMDDSDFENVSKVGHRRWILNPPLQQIGFGLANGYSTMQITDTSRTTPYDYDMIRWPNKGSFPVEYFSGVLSTFYKPSTFQKQTFAADAGNQAWSVSLNPTRYQTPVLDDISVEVNRYPNRKQWKLDSSHSANANKEKNKDYFTLDTSNIGINNAIIFRLGGVEKYEDGQVYSVTIRGVKDIDGKLVIIRYETNFFNLSDTNNMLRLSAEELILKVGESSRLVGVLGSKTPLNPNGSSDKSILWQTYNSGVATLDKEGNLVAKKEGSCYIRAYTADNRYSKTCIIRVVPAE